LQKNCLQHFVVVVAAFLFFSDKTKGEFGLKKVSWRKKLLSVTNKLTKKLLQKLTLFVKTNLFFIQSNKKWTRQNWMKSY